MNNLDLKIMWIIALLLGLWMNPVQAEESKTNPVVDKITSVGKSVKDGVVKEWNETVAYNKKAWEYGGENTWQFINMKETVKEHWRHNAHALDTQLAQNKKQISGYWQSIANALSGLAPKKENN